LRDPRRRRHPAGPLHARVPPRSPSSTPWRPWSATGTGHGSSR